MEVKQRERVSYSKHVTKDMREILLEFDVVVLFFCWLIADGILNGTCLFSSHICTDWIFIFFFFLSVVVAFSELWIPIVKRKSSYFGRNTTAAPVSISDWVPGRSKRPVAECPTARRRPTGCCSTSLTPSSSIRAI